MPSFMFRPSDTQPAYCFRLLMWMSPSNTFWIVRSVSRMMLTSLALMYQQSFIPGQISPSLVHEASLLHYTTRMRTSVWFPSLFPCSLPWVLSSPFTLIHSLFDSPSPCAFLPYLQHMWQPSLITLIIFPPLQILMICLYNPPSLSAALCYTKREQSEVGAALCAIHVRFGNTAS